MKALKAGTNITLTNDSTSVTINGPSTSGFQSTLTAEAPTGSHPILSGTTIKCLKSAGNLSLTSDGTSITINGSNTYTKAEVDSALNSKADLYSPNFTGVLGGSSISVSSQITSPLVLTPVIRGVLASDDVTIDDNLKINGDVTVGGTVSCNNIKAKTIAGIKLFKSDGTTSVKIF